MTSPLFAPIALRGLTLANRIAVSPMCQYQSVHGSPTDWHIVHMGRYAIGGAGIVFSSPTRWMRPRTGGRSGSNTRNQSQAP